MGSELQVIKEAGEQLIKTENFIVLGLIALAALLVIRQDPQAVAVTGNIVSGLLGYMGRTALAR